LKKNTIKFLVIFIFQLVCRNILFGQAKAQDSISFNNAVYNTQALYKARVGAQAGIYNGCDYQYERVDFGHHFFDSLYLVSGNIVYDNIAYTDIQMLYDLVRDEVVIQNYDKLHLTLLASNRVSQFSILGQTFIRISADSIPGSVINTGYYQILYNGRIKAYGKNKKVIEEFVDVGNELKKTATEKKKWYIYKDGIYFEVQGKKSILKVFGDKKNEIQQYAKQNKVLYKNNMDNALALIAAFYDKITN